MSKYLQFVLVILYAVMTITAIFIFCSLFGWLNSSPHTDRIFILVQLGWLCFCFSAAWFIPDILMLFRPVRRPILEEELWLEKCLSTLRERTGQTKKYRLRIEEEMSINAYATGHHTIVVSKGSLAELTQEELTAVIAHEMGHLTSRDGIAIMAYVCATYVPRQLSFILKLLIKFIAAIGIAGGLVGLIFLALLFAWFHLFLYLLSAIALVLLIGVLERIFRYLWLLNSRYMEYRQDAFAHQLGFGSELRISLLKIIGNTPQKVSFFDMLASSHPIIHNRIRRLEKLTGLRP